MLTFQYDLWEFLSKYPRNLGFFPEIENNWFREVLEEETSNNEQEENWQSKFKHEWGSWHIFGDKKPTEFEESRRDTDINLKEICDLLKFIRDVQIWWIVNRLQVLDWNNVPICTKLCGAFSFSIFVPLKLLKKRSSRDISSQKCYSESFSVFLFFRLR